MKDTIKTNQTAEFKIILEESDKVFFSGVYGTGKTYT
jgi:type IV secretory pathway ATPase VirB11/archaellum biosynthesis ATPase